METNDTKRIIISGGGTGGHIFPAIAIADTFKRRYPDAEILFIGAKGRMEMERVPKAGYPIKGLWISGFQRRLTLKNLVFPIKVIVSTIKAKSILRSFKPDVVIGVGGYASGPTLRAAVKMKIPALIQEQNSFPGLVNKVVGHKVNCVCVAYDNMDKWFPKDKIVLTGNPLRVSSIDITGKKEEAYKYFNLDDKKSTVLIVGGSQGALGINKGISAQLSKIEAGDYQMLWQTGKDYLATAKAHIKEQNLESKIRAVDFIDRMDFAYSIADVVISRAGAIAISELAAVGKPVIFVPLPTAAEDHQTKNAMRLVEANAAEIVTNADACEKLLPTLSDLMTKPEKMLEMSKNIKLFAKIGAAEKIVDEIEKLLK